MTTKTDYNGFANWETWNVCLWLDNEFDLYTRARLERLAGGFNAESRVEEFVRELMPNGTPDFDNVKEYDVVDWSEVMEQLVTE